MAKWGLEFVNSVLEQKIPEPPFAAHLKLRDGLRFETIEAGRVVQVWTVAPHFTLPDGIVHGGLLCSVADVSQAMALFTTHEAFEAWSTLDFHTRFVRPIKSDDAVRIESKVVNKSRHFAVVETTFSTTMEGKLLATVTGGWTKPDRQRNALPS